MQAISDLADVASLLSPLGYRDGSCGYCKGVDSSASYYVTSKHLTIDHYQKLVDRGWRRSGGLLYKPDPRYSCCPHYTIRLRAADFKPRKDQKQAVNRWNRFVLGDEYIKDAAIRYPISKADKVLKHNGFDLLTAVHEAEHDQVKQPPTPAHVFSVTLEPDTFTKEKYDLFKAYQEHVHNDKHNSQSGFRNFLCSSPLNRLVRKTPDGKDQLLGSHHQLYRLDGRLIAMAVLDLLPHCVSGVYFIYHPDFEKWSFGKISAMREAALALGGGYEYYYMGYYIHSCKKMRYKLEYKPQMILDFETNEWDYADEKMLSLMDKMKYVSMSKENKKEESRTTSDTTDSTGDDDKTSVITFSSTAAVTEAYAQGTSLFDIGLPGMMSLSDLEEQVKLGDALFLISRKQCVPGQFLVGWEDSSPTEPQTPKGMVAEMMACIGADLAKEVIADFSS